MVTHFVSLHVNRLSNYFVNFSVGAFIFLMFTYFHVLEGRVIGKRDRKREIEKAREGREKGRKTAGLFPKKPKQQNRKTWTMLNPGRVSHGPTSSK